MSKVDYNKWVEECKRLRKKYDTDNIEYFNQAIMTIALWTVEKKRKKK